MSRIGDNTRLVLAELPDEVTLVAVSKTKPIADILESYEVGQRIFGENRPQEMREKWEAMPKDIRWHMIGHLQTNKLKYIVEFVDLIHSVDSLKLLAEIDKRASSIGRKVDVLLQVHIAAEDHKHGFKDSEVIDFFEQSKWQDYPAVNIKGLMGMATFTKDENQLNEEFEVLRSTYESIAELTGVKNLDFSTVSMGMSGDYKLAVDSGSNMVRVGSKIFGSRN